MNLSRDIYTRDITSVELTAKTGLPSLVKKDMTSLVPLSGTPTW